MKVADFKPMLAGKVTDVTALTYPLYAAPKLDGIRAHVIEGRLWSRNLKLIPNQLAQVRYGQDVFNGLDGELIVGRADDVHAFRRSGAIMAKGGDANALVFHIFDDFTRPDLPFDERLRKAARRIKEYNTIEIVEHTPIETPDELLEYEAAQIAKGYEGVMVREVGGPYKFGRSTTREGWLLKLKRFEDGEAEIIGYEEFQHNFNEKDERGKRTGHKAGKVAGGKLGNFLVRDLKTGVEFNVGSGFTDNERINFWSSPDGWIGQIIKYRYFPTGSKDKPRFPTYEGLRHPIDI